jgi:hypothetical protein
MKCKFIKKDGTQCRGTMLFEDGFCIHHSKSERADEARAKIEVKKAEKEKSLIAKKFKFPLQSPLKQIRKNCVECCGNSSKTVMFCASVDCKLWFLRFGMLPKAFVRKNGKEHAQLFNKENFKTRGKYDPEILIEDMKL